MSSLVSGLLYILSAATVVVGMVFWKGGLPLREFITFLGLLGLIYCGGAYRRAADSERRSQR